MRKLLRIIVSISLLLSVTASFAACGKGGAGEDTAKADERTPAEIAGNVLYVSPDGDDAAGDGSETKPFATVSGARDAIRKIKAESGLPEGGITVLIAGGTYRISEPVEFTSDDSGEEGKPVTYKAKNGEEAIIDGGYVLKGDDFKPVNDTFKARLQTEDARANVVEIDLAKVGVPDLAYNSGCGWGGEILYNNVQELYFEGERQTIARWPNGEYAVSEVVSSIETVVNGNEMTEHKMVIPEGKAALWQNNPMWFCGLIYNGWETNNIAPSDFVGVDVEGNYVITRTMKGFFYPCNSGRPFYVYNIAEELDEPGEYFWDTADNKLYYYPTSDIAGKELYFSQVEKYLFHMTDTSYIAFDGLTFEHGRGSGIRSGISEGAENTTTDITVRNCTFTCLGGCALALHDTVNTVVEYNRLYELGCAGLTVTNATLADRTPSNNYIRNNLIHDWSQFYPTANPGIEVAGMGFYVGHNELYNSPHTGIQLSCGDSIVEYNILHDLCSMSGDAGAVYNGGSWAKIGNVYRYNYIYNIIYEYSDLCPNGIYLDDQICGQLAYGNTIRNTSGNGISVSGGKFMTVRNNVLIDIGGHNVGLGDNGISFQTDPILYNGAYEGYWAALSDMDYTSEFIGSMYPELLLYLEIGYTSSKFEDPGTPAMEIVENNIVCGKHEVFDELVPEDGIYVAPYESYSIDGFVNAGGLNYQNGVVRNNLVYDTDPGFTKTGNVDDALAEDSQVYRDLYNFERIPYEKIGIEEK